MATKQDKTTYDMRRYDLLGSMKQSNSPFLMQENEFTYLKNISYDEIGSLSKDGGYSQYGADLNAGPTGKIDMLHDYISGSTHTLLAIANGDLMKADATPTWSSINNSTFTADTFSRAANYLGNAFITNGTDGLYYTNGTTVTSVSSDNGGATVKGKYLAVLNNTLYLGHLTGTHSVRNVVYTTPGSKTFYVSGEEGANTYATTNNKFAANGPITGMVAFQGVIIYFTEDEMYLFNPSNASVTVIGKFGCVSNETIQEINGRLYWANRDGIFTFDGANTPVLISLPITNWATNSLWRVIDGAYWSTMRAASFEGKYMLYVGDLTAIMPGDDATINEAIIVYDTYRDTWSFLDGHPVSVFAKFVNSDGNQRLLFGSLDEPAVMQRGYTYTQDGSAITMVVRSKYFSFDSPEDEKVLKDFLMTYRPEGETDKYITVKVATNGSNNYVTKLDSSSSTKLELDGVTGTEFQLERTTMAGLRARTVSYEFSNADSGVNMTLLGYTQEFTYLNANLNYST